MLNSKELNKLKKQLKEEEKALESQLNLEGGYTDRDQNQTETVGELSSYDNHPADLGTELYEREKNFALEDHADSELGKVKQALTAIEESTYGKCIECGEEIPFERLEAIPSTLYCLEHSPQQTISDDRPVEEDILQPSSVANSFRGRSEGGVIDTNDSFEEVARFGTSEGPQDLVGDYNDYDQLYNKGINEEAPPEEIEEYVSNDINGSNRQFHTTEKKKGIEELLDRKGIESQMGDIPYKKNDGYIKEDK